MSVRSAGMEEDFWQPQLKKLQAFGPTHSNKFEWPTLAQLKKFDLRKNIRLNAIEVGATTNLYGLRLHFTNNISSPYFNAFDTRDQSYDRHDLQSSARLSDIYISQDDQTGNIQGMRLVDESGNFLVD